MADSSPSKRTRDADEAASAASSSSSSSSKPVLYSYWRSSCSWRVRIALAMKGIDYEYKAMPLLEGAQMKEDYAKLNPMRELPTLIIDGNTLTQSLAIIEYLEEAYPDSPRLLPTGAADRAAVRAIALMIASDMQPVQNLRVLQKVMSAASDPDEKTKKKVEWGKWVIENGFRGLEAALQKTAGKHAFGDSITLADLCVVPQVYNANRFGIDMAAFPTIARVCAAAEQLDAFKAAQPSNMPDKF